MSRSRSRDAAPEPPSPGQVGASSDVAGAAPGSSQAPLDPAGAQPGSSQASLDPAGAQPGSVVSQDPASTPPDPVTLALSDALTTVGDRWTLIVVAALLDGPRRFGELQTHVYGIAPNVLSQRLRHLERHGLLVARPYSRRPPRFAYELTGAGLELAGALRLLADWGARNVDDGSPRHAACGTPVEARWWCPTCERPIDEQEIGEVHFA